MLKVTERIKEISQEITLKDLIKDGPVSTIYSCCFQGSKSIIRFDKPITKTLKLNRSVEKEVLNTLYKINIAPEVLFSDQKMGITIWRYVEADLIKESSFSNKSLLKEIAQTLKVIHQTQPPKKILTFNSFVDCYKELLSGLGHRRIIQDGIEIYKKIQIGNESLVLSHNDLNPGNLLWSKRLTILDWEYVSLNDAYFDLACIVSSLRLDEENTNFFLRNYGIKKSSLDVDKINLCKEFNLFLTLFWLLILRRHSKTTELQEASISKLKKVLSQTHEKNFFISTNSK